MVGFFLSFILAVVSISFLARCSAKSTSTTGNPNRVLVWLCLEFCEEDSNDIKSNLRQIEKYKDVLSAVSFEKYTLGPNLTLIDNHLTEVNEQIHLLGLESWPLLSSYPHVPEFIDYMRQVFEHPEPFIAQCIAEAKRYKYQGYSLDWEPTENVTENDGSDYAKFIATFSSQLQAEGLHLAVDIASWSPVWNYTAIADSGVETAVSMGTYASNFTTFSNELDKLLAAFPLSRAGAGLEPALEFTEDEVKQRFDLLLQRGVGEIDLWKLPIPDMWWPYITKFYANGR